MSVVVPGFFHFVVVNSVAQVAPILFPDPRVFVHSIRGLECLAKSQKGLAGSRSRAKCTTELFLLRSVDTSFAPFSPPARDRGRQLKRVVRLSLQDGFIDVPLRLSVSDEDDSFWLHLLRRLMPFFSSTWKGCIFWRSKRLAFCGQSEKGQVSSEQNRPFKGEPHCWQVLMPRMIFDNRAFGEHLQALTRGPKRGTPCSFRASAMATNCSAVNWFKQATRASSRSPKALSGSHVSCPCFSAAVTIRLAMALVFIDVLLGR